MDLRGPVATQATAPPPDATSPAPVGTHLRDGLSQVLLSLLRERRDASKDLSYLLLGGNMDQTSAEAVALIPGVHGIVDRISPSQKQGCEV